jgi:hypothetical protein
MAGTIRRVEYFYITIEDRPGEGARVLERLKTADVNLIAFTAFPIGEGKTQLDFFPDNLEAFRTALGDASEDLVGPKRAFLIQGEDRPGAVVELHQRLAATGINAYAANGVSNGHGAFGYVLWVRPEEYEKAASALQA